MTVISPLSRQSPELDSPQPVCPGCLPCAAESAVLQGHNKRRQRVSSSTRSRRPVEAGFIGLVLSEWSDSDDL